MPWFIGLQLCFYCSGGKRLAAVFQHSKRCLISLCHFPALFHLFLLQSLNPSIHSLSLCPTSDSSIFQSSCSSSFYSFFTHIFPISVSTFNSLSGLIPHLLPTPTSPLHSTLCSRAKFANSHLSMSIQLPSSNNFQEHPPVSSLGGHKEKLTRRSDNPLTPHLSSARGKAPS